MDFGMFEILGLLIAAFGVKIVAGIVVDRREIFDDDITPHDRTQISQAAFFVILPLTVAAHELGHAIMVKVFGAEILSVGFYFFSGFVEYQGRVTETQQILIAAAGVTVNLLMGAIAIAVVFLKRPPMRPAINELLIQATTISVVNALIFYPLLDLATSLNGDFRQMYFGGVPWLSATIFAVHASILIGAIIASRSDRVTDRLAELTALPPNVRRSLLGGLTVTAPSRGAAGGPATLSAAESTMQSAGRRVASGWLVPLQGAVIRRPEGPALLLRWGEPGALRSVAVVTETAGSVAITLPSLSDPPLIAVGSGQVWRRWSEMPEEDELTLSLRLAMEEAERRFNSRVVASPQAASAVQ